MIYTLETLFKTCNSVHAHLNGKYVPARPESGPWLWRMKAAWLVFQGKADAIVWPEGQ